MFILIFVDVHNLVSLVTLWIYINEVQKILITYIEFFVLYVDFNKLFTIDKFLTRFSYFSEVCQTKQPLNKRFGVRI